MHNVTRYNWQNTFRDNAIDISLIINLKAVK